MTYEATAETITFIHGQAAGAGPDGADETEQEKKAPGEIEGAPGEDDKMEDDEATVE